MIIFYFVKKVVFYVGKTIKKWPKMVKNTIIIFLKHLNFQYFT